VSFKTTTANHQLQPPTTTTNYQLPRTTMPRIRVGIVHDFTMNRPRVSSGTQIPRARYTGKKSYVTPQPGNIIKRSHIRVGDLVSQHKGPTIKVTSVRRGSVFGYHQNSLPKKRKVYGSFSNQTIVSHHGSHKGPVSQVWKSPKLLYRGGRS
jgi:hypothetical protein